MLNNNIIIFLLLTLLTGCGQSGKLYLPDKTQVIHHTTNHSVR